MISFESGPGCFPLQTMIGSRKAGEPIIRSKEFQLSSSFNDNSSAVNQDI